MFLFVWVFFFPNVGKLKTNSLSSFIFHNIQYLSIPKPISFYSLFLCLSVCLSICLSQIQSISSFSLFFASSGLFPMSANSHKFTQKISRLAPLGQLPFFFTNLLLNKFQNF